MSVKAKNIIRNLLLAFSAILLYNTASELFQQVSCLIIGVEKTDELYLMVDSFLVITLLFVYGFWLYRFHRKEGSSDVVLTKPIDKKMLLTLFVVAMGIKGIAKLWLIGVNVVLVNLFPIIAESAEGHTAIMNEMHAQPYIWTFLSVAFVGPIVEELLFRGVVFHYLEKIRKGWFPILVSGIAFGLWHRQPIQCVYASMMGIAMGIVFTNVRNLKVVIAIHICMNFLSYLPPVINNDFVQLGIGILSLAMIVPAVRILVRMNRNNSAETALCTA